MYVCVRVCVYNLYALQPSQMINGWAVKVTHVYRSNNNSSVQHLHIYIPSRTYIYTYTQITVRGIVCLLFLCLWVAMRASLILATD